MSHDEHHEHLVEEFTDQLALILENSEQAIYLYLDDTHKTCNQKFADLLGYKSIEEWVANETPVSDIAEEDREKVIEAYGRASQEFNASHLSVRVVSKDGKEIPVDLTMVPLSFQGEVLSSTL